MKRSHGRILDVTEDTLGTTLTADAASGATTLYVDDPADFEDDGSGGWLTINDQVIAYDTVDDDAGTIHLLTGLTAAADDGDPVLVWSDLYAMPQTVKVALVQVDGDDDNADPIVATLADAIQDLPEGLRGTAGESCTLEQVSADEWEVTAIGGRPASAKGLNFEDRDTFTTSGGGDQSFHLSHVPEQGSVHLAISGAPQTHNDFTVDYSTGAVTVPDSLSLFAAGDVFDFRYAYRGKVASGFTIDWASAGWKMLDVPAADTTNRSAPNFNDAAWSVATAPFGDVVGVEFNYLPPLDWPAPATSFPVVTALWLRRTIANVPTRDLTVSVRCDNKAAVYWNGTLVGTTTGSTVGEYTFAVPASAVTSSNVLAVRAEDTGPAGAGNHSYIDVKVVS